jgi:TM2 domain-containing membrane protein YozV
MPPVVQAGMPIRVVDQNQFLIALLLVIFLGHLGIHRFYMGYRNEGIAILLLQIGGWSLACVLIGFPLLAAAGVWWLVDLILIASNNLKMADGTPLR